MSNPIVDSVGSILALLILAGLGYRWYALSDDRRVLLCKWAASAGLVFFMLLLLHWGLRNPKLALLFIIPGVILSFIWLPDLVSLVIKPLTNTFDGGADEVEAKPFYFIAAAKRAKGLRQEAIAEIRKQLEKFPWPTSHGLHAAGNHPGRRLAGFAGGPNHDQRTRSQQPGLTAQQTATALHTLADWQMQQGRDPARGLRVAPTHRADASRFPVLPRGRTAHSHPGRRCRDPGFPRKCQV